MMYPSGVAIDGQGDVFVVDQLRNHVREISPAGVPLGEWGTQGGVPGQLDQPAGLAVDAQDNVYVADSNNDRVQKLSSAGAPLAQWSDLGAAYGRLNQPSDVALDRRGDIFILDAGNGRVVELSPIGNPQAAWRTTGSALAVGRNGEIYVSAGDSGIYRLSPRDSVDAHWGGPGLKPLEFSNAQGIALDRFGNLYVADSGNNRIQELSPTGRFLRSTSR
jgi:DNA-binding beta-propeller fold protein YncE